MRKILFLTVVLVFAMLVARAQAQQITGDYLETRSADVYTGQCFANGEVGLVGNEAILAWHVRHGSWEGVALDGLNVVGVVKAKATLGDPYANPYPAKSVMIVDRQATPAQGRALVSFAQHMGGELLASVAQVVKAPIDMEVLHSAQHEGRGLLRAGEFATVETRAISEKDHLCGNEATFYPPLTKMAHSMPAVAETDEYRGPGLGVSWTSHGKRSAFIGSFSQ